MLHFTATFWNKDVYSHGWIVPLIAAYLFWIRKQPLVETPDIDRWIGVAVLVALHGSSRVGLVITTTTTPIACPSSSPLLGVC